MQQFFRDNHSTYLSNSNILSMLGNGITVLVLTIALLYNAGAIAASNTTPGNDQLVLNDEKSATTGKVNISRTEMTPDTKKAKSAKDSQIGAFSLEDGAMEGFYGDGEYID